MPKKDMDYSQMVIYKICCKDLNITDIYIGHTCNLVKRRYKHKSDCCNENGKHYNVKLYSFIRANGGFDNWEVIEVDKCPCLDFNDALKIERYYIETLNATLNMVIPTRTTTEYYYSNKEIRLENHKKWVNENLEKVKLYNLQYREQNKERILERDRNSSRTYRENNKEKVKETKTKYYEKNQNEILEKGREYYEQNKSKIGERNKTPVKCDCGDILSFAGLKRHQKCQKHIRLMEKLILTS